MSYSQGAHAVANTKFEGTNIGQQIGQVVNNGAESYEQVVVEWMSPLDFNRKQDDVLSKREGNTGQWFMGTEVFRRWESGRTGPLWCHGIHGCGKTVLMSIVVNYLRHKYSEQKEVGIACMYCQYKDREKQTPRNLFASLWRQLYDVDADLPDEVQRLFAHRSKISIPTLDEVLSILKTQISRHTVVYLLVDALDECPEEGRTRLMVSRGLQDVLAAKRSNKSSVRLMVTSRSAVSSFPSFTKFEIQAKTNDIARVVSLRIVQGISIDDDISDLVRGDRSLSKSIRDTIIEKSDKMFLMVQLYLDFLETKTSTSDIRDALRSLPRGLDAVYSEVWSRIERQNEDSFVLAMQVFRWLIYTFRQLKIDELLHAIAVRPGQKLLDKGRIVPLGRLLSACQGLVTIDEKSNVVRLIHYTTQQYFDRNKDRLFPDAHNNLTVACLAYLRLDSFAKGPCDFDGSDALSLHGQKGPIKESRLLPKRLELHPFLKYAASHWGDHARETSNEVNDEAVLAFLHDSEALASSLQVRGAGYRDEAVEIELPQLLDAVISFGLCNILQKLMKPTSPAYVEVSKEHMRAMLCKGARLKWQAIVVFMLRAGTTIDLAEAISLKSDTLYSHIERFNASLDVSEDALTGAIMHDRQPTVVRYIDFGKTSGTNLDRATSVLFQSVQEGKSESFRLAIEAGADVCAIGKHGTTVLMSAALKDQYDMAKILVGKGADVGAVDERGSTAAFIAVEQCYPSLVELLLAPSASLSYRNCTGRDLLGVAVASQANCDRRLGWICNYGREPNLRSSSTEEQSSSTRQNSEPSVKERLISIFVNIRDPKKLSSHKEFMNIMHEDLEQLTIMKTLLARGADIKSTTPRDSNHESLLHLAIGNPDRLELLWEAASGSLDINVRDLKGRTPLHYSLAAGSVAGAAWCLRHGAEVNARDQYGATPLHLSVDSDPCLCLMLHFGVDINATDLEGRTPMHYAVMLTTNFNQDLRRAGAEETTRDKNGLDVEDYAETFQGDREDVQELYEWFGDLQTRYHLQPSSIEHRLDAAHLLNQRAGTAWIASLHRTYQENREWWIVSDNENSSEDVRIVDADEEIDMRYGTEEDN